MALAHNLTLTQKTKSHAKRPADFLLFGERPDSTLADVERVFAELGIPKRNG